MKGKRGQMLQKAIEVINGERQDVYGNPEDSFELIAQYWNLYLNGTGDKSVDLGCEDVALMMVLFKIARESNQRKDDNVIDAAGYLGIYGDLVGDNRDDDIFPTYPENCLKSMCGKVSG